MEDTISLSFQVILSFLNLCSDEKLDLWRWSLHVTFFFQEELKLALIYMETWFSIEVSVLPDALDCCKRQV